MGCSASRPANFITHHQNPTSNSSSSLSNSQLQSPYHSFSDPSSTPVSRTLSLPTMLVHHPPLRKGDSNHFVSLTSTTYRSLDGGDSPMLTPQTRKPSPTTQDFSGGTDEPLSPDSVINTWELMEGLDDDEIQFQSQFLMVDKIGTKKEIDEIEIEIESEVPRSYELAERPESKPLWKHLSEESFLSKMDFNVVSSHRKAMMRRETVCEYAAAISKPVKDTADVRSLVADGNDSDGCSCCLSGGEDRIVLYYTSLRGIRKTYDDCCSVRVILNGFRVCVDERDISMDRSYRTELQEALKEKAASLPQVFVKGKHIGGADEIKQLNESGQLAKLLEDFPVKDLGFVCESCGDARFLPCPNCNGSRKVYEEDEGKLMRCPNCNENGLIRCSGCCP